MVSQFLCLEYCCCIYLIWINHLYWSSFKMVFSFVCFWDSSYIQMSSFKSALHASTFIVEDSLEPDSSQLYIEEIKPLFLLFLMMISSEGWECRKPQWLVLHRRNEVPHMQIFNKVSLKVIKTSSSKRSPILLIPFFAHIWNPAWFQWIVAPDWTE